MKHNIPTNIGIDASKAALDIHVRPHDKSFSVENNAAGIRAAIRKMKSFSPERVVIEATGRIEMDFVIAAHKAGLPVVVANPLHVRRFAGAASCWICRRWKRTACRYYPRRYMSA